MVETESLDQRATRLTAAYRRYSWARFVAVFFPVPFVVLLFRPTGILGESLQKARA